MNPTNDLEQLLDEIRTSCKNGNRKVLSAALRRLMKNRRSYYRKCIGHPLMADFSDSLYKILLLELDEEESDSIETAELAYTSLSSLFSSENNSNPEYYKRRLLLLHYFCDYFTDAVIEIFLKKYRDENRLEARNLALECLEKMQKADIAWLDEYDPDYIDKDEQLSDMCHTFGTPASLSEPEQQEAELLHKILYAYLKTKYKN